MKKKQIDIEDINDTEVDLETIKSNDSQSHKVMISPEDKKSILKARAKALAVEQTDEFAQKEFIEIIVFSLVSETYGIESKFIREVYPLKDFTTLPGVPSFVIGIINVRGQIISIVDLKKFFNLPEKGLGALNKVIIIRNEKMEFGILADIIHGTRLVSLDSIHESPVEVNGIGAGYLKGVTGENIIILDAEKILGDDKIIVNQETD
jgi:purine-binding chemotaxis protein CheW